MFEERLYQLRREWGISQEELANIIGVSRQAVQKWESGASQPNMDNLVAISEYFGVTLDYLLKGGENDVFNLGNGVGFTNLEVVEMARKVTGHPIPTVIAPRRTGDPARLIASSEKAKTILGWIPRYADLETIVASAWNWHKKHPYGYKGE